MLRDFGSALADLAKSHIFKIYRDQILLVLAFRKFGVSQSSTVNITWIMSLSVFGFDFKSVVILNDTPERKVIRLILRSTLYFVHHVGVTSD